MPNKRIQEINQVCTLVLVSSFVSRISKCSSLFSLLLSQGSRKYFDSADELAKAAAASAAAVIAPAAVGAPAHAGPVAAHASVQSLGSSFDAASASPAATPAAAAAAGADGDNPAPLPALAIAAAPRGSLTGGTVQGLGVVAVAASALSHSGARILICDHIEASARMMQISLTHAKFAVDVCATGEEMIARAHSYRAVLFSMQVCAAYLPLSDFSLINSQSLNS